MTESEAAGLKPGERVDWLSYEDEGTQIWGTGEVLSRDGSEICLRVDLWDGPRVRHEARAVTCDRVEKEGGGAAAFQAWMAERQRRTVGVLSLGLHPKKWP